jgi:hypothetical protein
MLKNQFFEIRKTLRPVSEKTKNFCLRNVDTPLAKFSEESFARKISARKNLGFSEN